MLTCVLTVAILLLAGCAKVAVKQPDEGKNAASRTDRKEENKPGSDSSLSEQGKSGETTQDQYESDTQAPRDENGDDPGAVGLNLPVSQTGDPSANSSSKSDDVPGSAVSWAEYTDDHTGVSFRYPGGWNVDVGDSAIAVENTGTEEQLLMVMIPFDEAKSPLELASDFIEMLRVNNSNVNASNWRTDPQTEDRQVVFVLTDELYGDRHSGTGIVIKDSEQAVWFSYLAPDRIYSYDYGIALLEGFMGSLLSGSGTGSVTEPGSKNQGTEVNSESAARIDKNAKGFIFVLEFALGAPLTNEQEQVILNELKSSWNTLSKDELSAYDQYPLYADAILILGQADLDALRSELESAIAGWLEEAPSSDRTANIIRSQLNARRKIVIDGDPPLTEMSLTAYSEMIAYSLLLRKNYEALPEQISGNSVNNIKELVRESWDSFSYEEKEQIASSPGIWFCMRALVSRGSEKDQEEIRNNLIRLTPLNQNADDSDTAAAEEVAFNLVRHDTAMKTFRMTFNHYMFCQGFTGYNPATW